MNDDPSVQAVLRQSPCFFTEMELTDFLHEHFDLSDHPNLTAESGRLADQYLTGIEASPNGIHELSQSYREFEESGMEAALFGRPAPEEFVTVIGEPPDEPSCEPLPFMFPAGWAQYEPIPLGPRTRPELNDGWCGRVVQPKKQERDSSKR
jgi:hypothetical protein